MTLRWKGKDVTRRLKRAQVRAIDATMAAAVIYAKSNHPWRNRTGSAERSIQIDMPAHETSTGAAGRWGSLDIAYFLRLEFGFQGKDRLGRVYSQGPRPTLRPAADAEYPMLVTRIKALT